MSTAPDSSPSGSGPLTLFVASGVLGVFFVIWTWMALDHGSLFEFDKQCAEHWHEHASGRLRGLMIFLTEMGGIAAQTLVTTMAAVWQFSHDRRRFAAAWIGIMIGGALANQTLKIELDRARPGAELRDLVVYETNQSYPSGHSMGSAMCYGMLCYALVRHTRFPMRHIVLPLCFIALVGGIGFSRMYLRAHWFSDVIGGYVGGLCWLFFCLGWLERARYRNPDRW